MQVLCDGNGYITSFALVGNLVDGIEVKAPEDEQHFCAHFSAYRVRDANLVFDEAQDDLLREGAEIDAIRVRRERECFPVVNRGLPWYELLSQEQAAELKTWYQAWLDATTTRVVPEKPAWL